MNDFGRALHILALETAASVCLTLLLLFALGCGGGSSPASVPIPPPPPPPAVPQPRGDAWFAYYGDEATQLEETRGHVSMVWIAGWRDPAGRRQDIVIVERAAAACAAGKKVVLMMPPGTVYDGARYNPAAAPLLRGILSALGPARSCVAALFPVDEPDVNGVSHTALLEGNAALHAVLREFPETALAKMAVIYAGANDFPGLASYDWIGFDDYNAGDRVLDGLLEGLLNAMQPNQRAFLVPGGADPWRADPSPYVAKLREDPRIIGIVAFLWLDDAAPGVGKGIRSNGMKAAYCAAAVAIAGGTC